MSTTRRELRNELRTKLFPLPAALERARNELLGMGESAIDKRDTKGIADVMARVRTLSKLLDVLSSDERIDPQQLAELVQRSAS